MKSQWRRVNAFFLFALSALPSVAEPPHWQQPDYIIDSFITIALQREHGDASDHINKWQSPVFFGIDDRTGDKNLHTRMVTHHLRHLALITGLDIRPASYPSQVNLTVIFGSETDLEQALQNEMGITDPAFRRQLLHNSVCVARFRVADNNSQIRQAMVLIPVDRARAHARLMACVVEELTQVMGLANDASEVFPSVFNDRSFNDFLTGLDYLLLKLLYHPALKTDMNEAQLRKQLRQILTEEPFISLIPSADTAVREHSLENWLN